MDLTQFDGHTLGPWSKSDQMHGPWLGISSQYSVDGRLCESGRQSVANVHGAHRGSGYAAMFEANARLIAAAPELLAEVRRLTAEAAAMRRERDELAADYSRLLEKHNNLHVNAKRCRDERDELAARLAEIERAEPVILRANNLDAALYALPSPAAAPERAEPDHCEDALGMVCATRGALLGGRAVCGDIHPSSNTCCSTDRCVHQRPRPCRCGPDGCSDSTSCPRGER